MAYNENKPAATDKKNQSQSDIQGNFAALKTLIDKNHGTFDAGDEGKHKHVTFPEQGADVSTVPNEKVIYAKESALSSVAELFIRNENDGDIVGFTYALKATEGWTKLASGIQLVWGGGTIPDGTQGISKDFVESFNTNCLHVFTCGDGTTTGDSRDGIVSSTLVDKTKFTATRPNSLWIGKSTKFRFLAIGY